MGENFKSMAVDTTKSEESFTREPKKEKSDEVIVYPNPNDGNFIIIINNHENVRAIHITDNLGKRIDSRFGVTTENQYNKMNFKSGVYFAEIIFEDKVVRKKVIIN